MVATIQPIDIEGGRVVRARSDLFSGQEQPHPSDPQLSTCFGLNFQTTVIIVSILHMVAHACALAILLYLALSPSLAERFDIADDSVAQQLFVIWVGLQVVAGLGIVANGIPLMGALLCQSDLVMAGVVWLLVEFIVNFVLLIKPAFRITFGEGLVEPVLLSHLLVALWSGYGYLKLWIELEEGFMMEQEQAELPSAEVSRLSRRHQPYSCCLWKFKQSQEEILPTAPSPEVADEERTQAQTNA